MLAPRITGIGIGWSLGPMGRPRTRLSPGAVGGDGRVVVDGVCRRFDAGPASGYGPGMDVEGYRQAWIARSRAEAEATTRAATAVRALLPDLVEILVERFGATGVVLIGSLARSELTLRSDIDLVAAGVPNALFFKAGAALDRASGMHVDLIPWESATPDMRAVVAAEGEVLHGRL